MPSRQKLFSAVDHVVEHPDIWRQRLSPSKWGKRIPHLVQTTDGADYWSVDERKISLMDSAPVGALMPDRVSSVKRWEEMPKTAFIPTERLKAMDKDGVGQAVLYPSLAGFSGEIFAAIGDPDLELDCVQAYNDWLIDDWAGTSNRFIAQCIVPLSSIELAVAEIKRAIDKGHRGVILPAAPMHRCALPHINAAAYDPIWAICQELDVPLCFHAGSTPELCQLPIAPTLAPELAAALAAVIRPASAVFDLVNMLFSRILLRFPALKMIFAESTIGWGTFLLEYADHQHEQDHCNYAMKPSDMFHRQCYLTTWFDPIKINARHVGIGNILWATNFPAANSTWPDTRAYANKCLAGMSQLEQERILHGNAAELYNTE